MRTLAAFALLALLAGCASLSFRDDSVTIASRADFDPERYTGLWYEIARFPVVFQKGCTNTTAQYGTREDGTLSVLNTCERDGETSQITGSAELVGPGRLAVRFHSVPFVKAPYWVLWVDEDYQTAVVGTPSGRAGWILNRAPTLRADRLKAAQDILAFNGYDISKLIYTQQAE